MTQQVKQKKRNFWLDTLRGIAASWVVIFHLNEVIPREPHLYAKIASLGYLGVSIFFIVSGYCIWSAAERCEHICQFCWHRFCRIYPPYLVSLLVVTATCLIRKLVTGTNDVAKLPENAYEWLVTLTLTTSPITSVKTVNWVYWSLSYEIIFYLIIAITFIHPKRQIVLIYLLLGISLFSSLSNSYPFLFFLNHWALFALGIGSYMLISSRKINGVCLILVSSLSIAVNEPLPTQLIAYLICLSIRLSDCKNSWLNIPNWLTHVGQVSYSLYLLHVPIGCYLLLQARQGIWLKVLPFHILYDLVVLLGCIGLAFIFFQLIEKPSITLGQRLTQLSKN